MGRGREQLSRIGGGYESPDDPWARLLKRTAGTGEECRLLKLVQGLRDAGMTSYKAAQSKSNEKMLDAADAVTTACSNCHDRYRENRSRGSVYVIQ